MQVTNEEALSNNIDKIIKKINVLKSKKKLWGLNLEDEKELIKLTLLYMKHYYQLIDVIFNDYVEPFLYNDKIISIKNEMLNTYNWDGSLFFFDSDIENLLNNVKDKSGIINHLKELQKEELKMFVYFKSSQYGEEIIELFGLLQNISKDGGIEKYINVRYNTLISLIEGEPNESIN